MKWILIFFCLPAFGQLPVLPFAPSLYSAPTDTEWSLRVVANGGAKPSQTSITAMYNFLVYLTNNGLDTKVFYANLFAPDSLTATLTPVIQWTNDAFKATSNPPNNNGSFVLGDLTANGLKGDGSTKFMKLGMSMTNMISSSGGCFAYVYQAHTSGSFDFEIAVQQQSSVTRVGMNIATNITQVTSYSFSSPGSEGLTSTALATNGFYSQQRTGTTSWNLYYANSFTAHTSLTNSTTAVAGDPQSGNDEFFSFCMNFVNPSSTASFFSNARLSAVGVTKGLSSAEDSLLFTGVQNCRVALAGGYW